MKLKNKVVEKIVDGYTRESGVRGLEKQVAKSVRYVAKSIAMKLDNNDKIVGVKICKDDQDIILSTKLGKCIRFESKKLRVFKGRSSKGIKGIVLSPNDQIVSLSIIDNDKSKKNGKKSKDEQD